MLPFTLFNLDDAAAKESNGARADQAPRKNIFKETKKFYFLRI